MFDIGVMLNNLERDRLRAFAVATSHGFRIVHTNALPESWLTGPERARYVAAARESGLRIDTMFVGFDGQSYADWRTIAETVGLAIPGLREHRCHITRLYSDLARELGAPSLNMHLGFLSERSGQDYRSLVEAVRGIADYCRQHGQRFHLETGQEPASGLLRFLSDVGRPNLGVNFDPANFVLYGTDDPLNALKLLADHIGGVHCKDALPSGRPQVLGSEVQTGQGCIPFSAILQKLLAAGYTGPFIIEREAGEDIVSDILASRTYLESLLRFG
jgi:sugar phosphate isomerase/epimerase